MDAKIKSYDIKGPAHFTVTTENGTITGTPTSWTFNNDISQGNIDNSTQRNQCLQKSEHIKLNYSLAVDGTAQTSYGGVWIDVGSPELHSGDAAKAAMAQNVNLYALLTQYPDRDDGEPVYVPFPNFDQCLEKAQNITDEQKPCILPTITQPKDIVKWAAAYTDYQAENLAANEAKKLMIALQIEQEEIKKQQDTQKEYLTNKYGEEVYELFYKQKVEMGAVYTKDYNKYSITVSDVYDAAFSEDRAITRNANLAAMG